jgi:hypothetical protein
VGFHLPITRAQVEQTEMAAPDLLVDGVVAAADF